jgi:hypothetical protein
MHNGFIKEKNVDESRIGLQKRNALTKAAIPIILFLVVAISGCTSTGKTVLAADGNCADSTACSLAPADQVETSKEASNVQKIEVYHFHGTNQCYSCKTVGAYAEETVKTFFAQELESGKVVFAHINNDLPENQGLVKKYEVTSASLWIGVYKKDGGFSKEQNTTVWYKINNKSEYLNYLKGIIENKLKGN